MRVSEIAHFLRVARTPAPHGAQTLARCYSIEDVARHARRRLPLGARANLETGGEDEYTLRRNRSAFECLEFAPELPRDVSDVDTSTTVLGQRIPLPFALSPIGAPRMFHHEGELAVARAAGRAGIPAPTRTGWPPRARPACAIASTYSPTNCARPCSCAARGTSLS